MSDQANTLPPEWRAAAAETVRSLSIAKQLASRHATEEIPEPLLLPALLLSITVTRAGAEICTRLEQIAGDLAGIQLAIDGAIAEYTEKRGRS